MIRFWKKLHDKLSGEKIDIKDHIQTRYQAFLDLLTENEHALDLLTELETKYYSRQLISIPYLKNILKNLSRSIRNIIFDLETLTGTTSSQLLDIFDFLEKEVRLIMTGSRDPIHTPIIIPIEHISSLFVDKVGSKMANLGEVKNKCHLKIPDGFGLTACAYTHFSEYNNLSEKISDILSQVNITDIQTLISAEKEIKDLVKQAKVPPEIAESIHQEANKLEKKFNGQIFWAVRSSAIGEDLEHSFAGQFSSVLNVPTDNLLDKYKEVVSSKYNLRSMLYQRIKSIHLKDVNMSVGFLQMVNPVCSGVLYTTDPVHPHKEEMVISAVWGLGQLLVEGVISADTYIIKRSPGFPVVRQDIVFKEVILRCTPEGGVRHDCLPRTVGSKPCLTNSQLEELTQAAMTIENHFKQPQDIEWAFDQNNQLIILQTRPLHLTSRSKKQETQVKAPIIARDLPSVAAGVGAGKVLKPKDIHDLFNLPEKGILVLKHSSPQYIAALQKAAAVVVEKGNMTDHMSSVVRELHVPCVVRVPQIFSRLKNGEEVTVDASSGIIYQGIVKELLLEEEKTNSEPIQINIARTESYRLLQRLAKIIFPLNLTDPRKKDFQEKNCRTWHDIIRFCHERALNEMFALRENTPLQNIKNVYQVRTQLPVKIYLLDLFEDAVSEQQNTIDPSTINSLPFRALWEGMNLPGLPWDGPQGHQADLGNIISSMLNAPALEGINYDTKSFAVVTHEYLNFSLSLGYHYVVVDSYLSDDPYLNHITLSFKGGAADLRKRRLRVKLVASILEQTGFTTNIKEDFLKARIKAVDGESIEKALFKVGALLGMTRLLDLSLNNEESVERYREKFYRIISPEAMTC